MTNARNYATHGAMNPRLTTSDAARVVGIHRATLQRWIRARKIKPPKPTLSNGRGVRLWSRSDIEVLRKAKKLIYRRGGGRKKKKV